MDSRGSQGAPALPGALLLILILSGLVVYRNAPLDSSRPSDGGGAGSEFQRHVLLPGRLWEDSLLKSQQHFAAHRGEVLKGAISWSKAPDHSELASVPAGEESEAFFTFPAGWQPDAISELDGAEKIVLMPIFVEGTSYVEDQEQRRRSRHAVVSGLSVSGFQSVRGENINYFMFMGRWRCVEQQAPELSDSVLIPFEWFRRDGTFVLVMWIDDVQFGAPKTKESDWRRDPIETLERFSRGMKDYLSEKLSKAGSEATFSLRVLGPRSSTALVEMLDEISAGARCCDKKTRYFEGAGFDDVDMFSPWTTVDAVHLLTQPSLPVGMEKSEDSLRQLFEEAGLPFDRLGRDGDLAGAILRELGLRGIHVDDAAQARAAASRPHVVLITEEDTLYGRAFAQEFSNRVATRPGAQSPVLVFHYLRGLDGKTLAVRPGSRSAADAAQDGNGASGNTVSIPGWTPDGGSDEEAWGPTQSDYLRRMSAEIIRQDQLLRRDGRGKVAAIGIVGNDVFDKLMILKALRGSFPGCVFFTTDLDSTLMRRREFEYTRNLVVASHFGLSLNDEVYQGDVPPFRSSYQCAMFYAALRAVGYKGIGEESRLPTLMYEIGRTAPFQLAPRYSLTERRNTAGLHPRNRQPYPSVLRPDLKWYSVALAALLVFTVSAINPRVRRRLARMSAAVVEHVGGGRPSEVGGKPGDAAGGEAGLAKGSGKENRSVVSAFLVSGFVLLTIVAAFAAVENSNSSDGEPFMIFEGISTWPTVFVRLGAMFLALYLLLVSLDAMWRRREKIRPHLERRDDPASGDSSARGRQHEPAPETDPSPGRRYVPPPAPRSRTKRLAIFAARSATACFEDWTSGDLGDLNGTNAERLRRLWIDYDRKRCPGRRNERLAALMAAHLLFYLCLLMIGGDYFHPYRGTLAARWDVAMQWGLTLATMVLNIYVLDAILMCRAFVEGVRNGITEKDRGQASNPRRARTMAADWMSCLKRVELVASLTETVGGLIYYSFGILVLVIIARNPYFDNYNWPFGVSALLGVFFGSNFVALLLLQRSAKRLKDREEWLLREVKLQVAMDKSMSPLLPKLEETLSYVTGLRRGAFLPLADNPLVRALAFPLSGAGGLAMLQYLLTQA